MKRLKNSSTFILAAVVSCMAVGCALLQPKVYQKSSVMEYLYPSEKEYVEKPAIPVLSLPVRVGIAFVPEASRNGSLTEKDKMGLMKEISAHFKKYEFVKTIDLIPSAYLKPKGSFVNLDQIRTMYGIDVISLVSYDQAQFTDEGMASIAYWTIIGAYFVPGEKNDTHTMLDVVVYDIKSRKMLFRAPGISQIKSKATPVNLSEQMREDSHEGFLEASKDLVINLDEQLALFKEKVKEAPDEFKVVHQPGYTGGGSMDAFFVALVVFFGALFLCDLIRHQKA